MNQGSITLLVVDDEQANLDSLRQVFEREGYRVLTASSGDEGLNILRHENIGVALVDLMMPGTSGVDLLRAARHVCPDTEIIMITAYGTIETAVAAMKEGAYDFITKPIRRAAIVRAVRRAVERQVLLAENRSLRAQLAAQSSPDKDLGIIGNSPIMIRLMEVVKQAAASNATVLLLGESGTGKELIARALHQLSPRAAGPFVAVNCGALPETILESELFGYEKGAFTGAAARREGYFERANGGTLLLDEVGEMSPHVQVRLLRALQEGEIDRLGGSGPIAVDVRVVAATNRDLLPEVKEGQFREDLYYRLNVIPLQIPPLRHRPEDVPLLVDHFLRGHAEKNQRPPKGLTREALGALTAYSWPGNVRELENILERALVLGRGEVIEIADLPPEMTGGEKRPPAGVISVRVGIPLDEIEKRLIQETLHLTGGDKTLAARLLGIATRTIYRKLDEIEREEEETREE